MSDAASEDRATETYRTGRVAIEEGYVMRRVDYGLALCLDCGWSWRCEGAGPDVHVDIVGQSQRHICPRSHLPPGWTPLANA